jgi:hypothetical protein
MSDQGFGFPHDKYRESLPHPSSEGGVAKESTFLLLMSLSRYLERLGLNWVKRPTVLIQPIQIFPQFCVEERMNTFGIVRGEWRQLWCSHSLREDSIWLDFLLLWWVVQNLQRRYFLTQASVTNASIPGHNQDSGTVLCFPYWRAVIPLSEYIYIYI